MGVAWSIPVRLIESAGFDFRFSAVLVALGFNAAAVVAVAADFDGANRALKPLKALDDANDIVGFASLLWEMKLKGLKQRSANR